MAPSVATLERAAARNILARCLKVQRGENVTIESWTHTLPVAGIFVDEARRLGAKTLVLYEDEAAYWDALDRGEAKLLGAPGEAEWAALDKTDVFLYFWGPEDRPRMDRYPDRVWDQALAWNPTWYEHARKSGLRGVRLEASRATDPVARKLGVSPEAYRRELWQGSAVDPSRLERSGIRLKKALDRGRRLRLRHPNGTDLELGLAGLTARLQSGRTAPKGAGGQFGMMANIPSGIVSVPLDPNVAEGVVVANRKSYNQDLITSGARWTFRDGVLTSFRHGSGGKEFAAAFAKGKPGRDQPGYLSLGLNPAIHQAPNMEDAELGAALVSVGGNRFLGGTNASTFMGWAVVAGAEVSVDGDVIISGGRLR